MDEEEDTPCPSAMGGEDSTMGCDDSTMGDDSTIGDDDDRSERYFQFVRDLIASGGSNVKSLDRSDGRKMFSVYDVMRIIGCWTEGTMPVVYSRAVAKVTKGKFGHSLENVMPNGGNRKTPCMDMAGLSMLMGVIRPSCMRGRAEQKPRKRAKKDSAKKGGNSEEASVETQTTLELRLRLELTKVELELEKARAETERLRMKRKRSCGRDSPPAERTPTPEPPAAKPLPPEPPAAKPLPPEPPVLEPPVPEPPVAKPLPPEPPVPKPLPPEPPVPKPLPPERPAAKPPTAPPSSSLGDHAKPQMPARTSPVGTKLPPKKVSFTKPPGTEGGDTGPTEHKNPSFM